MVRLCVLGSSNMDLVVRAPDLPAAGETLLGGPFGTFPGGKGANQAIAARRAGAEVTFVTALGADDFGNLLRVHLLQDGLDLSDVQVEGASGVALITVDDRGENTIVVAPGANAALLPEHVEAHRAAIGSMDLCIAQLEVPLEAVRRLASLAREEGVPFLLNAAPAQALSPSDLSLVDILVVNEGEAQALLGHPSRLAPEELVQGFRARGIQRGAITLGSRGCFAWSRGEERAVPAFEVEAVDTVGAGDAFVGAYAVALAEGRNDFEAARRGNAAGALAARIQGAWPSLPDRPSIDALLA